MGSKKRQIVQGGPSPGMNAVYHIAHNIAKFEEHAGGKPAKPGYTQGATQAFPPGHSLK